MKQHEFIWMTNNVHASNVVQDDSGNTAVTLRKNILLVHNYKKKDQMSIILVDTNSQFLIPSKKELESIFRLHLENKDLNEIIVKYCTENLSKIN